VSDDVTIPFGSNPSDQAVLLLAAAEELDLDPGVVRTSEGAFVAPSAVNDKAFSPPAKKATAPAKKAAKKK
jgi:hypothetical protein